MDKNLSFLGLAMRAGAVVSGEFSVENAVREGKAFLVLISEDASANTKKKFTDKCSYYQVPLRVYGTKETLGRALGKAQRTSAAVTGEGFAKALIEGLDKGAEKKADGENQDL